MASVIGVGTQTKIASASPRPASPAVVDDRETVLEGRGQALVVDVVDRRAARAQLADARLVDVDADDLKPGLDERDRQRQPDIPEADDGDALVAVLGGDGQRGLLGRFGHGWTPWR